MKVAPLAETEKVLKAAPPKPKSPFKLRPPAPCTRALPAPMPMLVPAAEDPPKRRLGEHNPVTGRKTRWSHVDPRKMGTTK